MSARRSLWLAALLAAAPAPAFAQDMCAALARIAAASREQMPFASLERAAREGRLVPGYYEGECEIRPGRTLVCWRRIAGPSLSLEAMEQTLRDCLGRAPLLRPDRPSRTWGDPDLVFVRQGLRYEFSTDCTPQCRAGMLATLAIRIEPRRRRR